MVEKTIPWWRRALIYALSEIRSGFGFFSRPVQSVPLEEGSSLGRPDGILEEDAALTSESAKPETIADEPVKPVHAPAGLVQLQVRSEAREEVGA